MKKRRMHWYTLFFLVLSAGAIVAVACGGGEKATSVPAPTVTTAPVATTAPAAATAVPATATPAATATTAASPAGGGTLVVGAPAICPPTFIMKFVTGACFERVQMWGFMEGVTWMKDAAPPLQVDEEDTAKSMIESWDLDSDANTLTWVIKTGIPFQDKRWGEVAAQDVAFSFNQAFAEGSTFNRVGQLKAWIDTIEAVDDRTVKIQCTDSGCQKDWIRQQSNYNGQTASISSIKAFNELGEDAANRSLGNSTGPFMPTKWVADEEIIGEAVRPHWRHTPIIDKIRYVAIPENAVRAAAFEAGEIQMTFLPPALVSQAVNAVGGRSQQIGGGRSQGISFGGNYWASSDYLGRVREGEDATARPGYKPDDAHPWIGEWGNDASMERARKVRLALAMMVDRDKLNDGILGGLGSPAYSYFGWQPSDPEWKDEWRIDFDAEGAQALLKEVGLGDGFDVPLYVIPDVRSVWDPEITEAIGQMWTDGGLNVKIEKTAYSARRPTFVSRSIDIPWAGVTGGASNDKGEGNAAGGRVPVSGGWGAGFELPDEIGIKFNDIENANDPKVRRALNAEVSDFINKWVLQPSFVEEIPFWAVRPEVIEWSPYTGNLPYFNNPQTVRLSQ